MHTASDEDSNSSISSFSTNPPNSEDDYGGRGIGTGASILSQIIPIDR